MDERNNGQKEPWNCPFGIADVISANDVQHESLPVVRLEPLRNPVTATFDPEILR